MTHAQRTESPTEILKELVRIDSRVSKSNLKILTKIQQLIGTPGHLERFTKRSANGLKVGNLFHSFDGQVAGPRIIFVGHTDTVNPNADWKTNPFQPTVRRGRMVGLGSTDMKAGLAAMIAFARRAQREKPQFPLTFIFDADEEGDVEGADNILQHHNFHDAWVNIPEATLGQITLGQRACLDFRVRTKGFSVHASLAKNNPKNSALYRATAILDALMHDEATRLHGITDPTFGRAIQSIGQIAGGTGINTVADRVEFVGTRRLVPGQSLKEEERQLKKLVKRADPTARVTILFRGPGYHTDRTAPLVQALEPIVSLHDFRIEQGWTEAGAFQHWGDVVVFGPGNLGVAHTANEALNIDELTHYIDRLSPLLFGKKAS